MGIDLTITVATGVVLDAEAFTKYREQVDPYHELWGSEFLEHADNDTTGIGFGVGGSEYDETPDAPYLYVARLTTGYDQRTIPGGIIDPTERGLSITREEHERIVYLARELGTESPVVHSFIAVHWF